MTAEDHIEDIFKQPLYLKNHSDEAAQTIIGHQGTEMPEESCEKPRKHFTDTVSQHKRTSTI